MKSESPSIHKTVSSLIQFLESGFDYEKETIRIARVGSCLLTTGGNFNNRVISKCENIIFASQHIDGGWNDTEETLWSLAFLKQLGHNNSECFKSGFIWLKNQRHRTGGWGRSNRDIGRLPITGILLYLLPMMSDQDSLKFIKNEWENDLNGDTPLTYKGGFFLMGLSASGVSAQECPLIKETYSFLTDVQNGDGGFGPWKDHPIGSDPWSTGIVLLGLLSYPELISRNTIEKTVNWLAAKQLPNGLWPYHYIEEGSAYAYWGLVEALKYLSKGKN